VVGEWSAFAVVRRDAFLPQLRRDSLRVQLASALRLAPLAQGTIRLGRHTAGLP